MLKKDKEAVKFAEEELLKLCSSWASAEWDELDWSRLKDLQLRTILDERKKAALAAEQRQCVQCPNFLRHVSPVAICTEETWKADVRLVCYGA